MIEKYPVELDTFYLDTFLFSLQTITYNPLWQFSFGVISHNSRLVLAWISQSLIRYGNKIIKNSHRKKTSLQAYRINICKSLSFCQLHIYILFKIKSHVALTFFLTPDKGTPTSRNKGLEFLCDILFHFARVVSLCECTSKCLSPIHLNIYLKNLHFNWI